LLGKQKYEIAHLCSNHSCSLRHTSKSLADVPAAAYEGHLEVVLVNVVAIVCWRQHLQHVDLMTILDILHMQQSLHINTVDYTKNHRLGSISVPP